MATSLGDIVSGMIAAARASLGKDFPKIKDFAKPEFQRLAKSALDIGKLVAEGKVTKKQAQALFEIHKNTTRMVFITVEGLGIIAAENAINAALKSARDAVNGILGFALL